MVVTINTLLHYFYIMRRPNTNSSGIIGDKCINNISTLKDVQAEKELEVLEAHLNGGTDFFQTKVKRRYQETT